jgi:hypothetical protein
VSAGILSYPSLVFREQTLFDNGTWPVTASSSSWHGFAFVKLSVTALGGCEPKHYRHSACRASLLMFWMFAVATSYLPLQKKNKQYILRRIFWAFLSDNLNPPISSIKLSINNST